MPNARTLLFFALIALGLAMLLKYLWLLIKRAGKEDQKLYDKVDKSLNKENKKVKKHKRKK